MPMDANNNSIDLLDWSDRRQPQTLCLFDVDGTLTPARKTISTEMLNMLRALKRECVIGFVGGSVDTFYYYYY